MRYINEETRVIIMQRKGEKGRMSEMHELPMEKVEEMMEEIRDLKIANTDLRKARGCDEIIMEQLRHKREKAEAEVERLHKRWYDLRREVDSCPDFAVVGEVMDQLELGKAQKGGK